MAKKIGAVNQSEQDDLRVEALSGLDDQESAELIAQHFASISQEYLPLNRANLPAFLPALPPPRDDEPNQPSPLTYLTHCGKSSFLSWLAH